MLKKILLVTAIASVTSGVSMADPCPYVGANLGIVNNTTSNVANNPNYYRGVPFNVFAGFGGIVNQNFYLAGEVFGTIGTADISDSTRVKTSYGYGASALPGVMLSDHTLAFARLGIVESRFSNAQKTRTGGQVGVGLQTTLTQNVDLRAEYDFTSYSSFTGKNGRVASPRQDAFNLGLVYNFG